MLMRERKDPRELWLTIGEHDSAVCSAKNISINERELGGDAWRRLVIGCAHWRDVHHLTSHKVSDRWRERVSLQVEGGSHRKLNRGAASG
jgi:hypothetical protein